jgi:hypothetical protein
MRCEFNLLSRMRKISAWAYQARAFFNRGVEIATGM